VDRAEGDQALERAIALAPTTSAEPYIHLIEHAFADADSARVARLMDAYERITHGAGLSLAAFQLAFDLGFGDPAARARALALLETVPTETLMWTILLLGNPHLHGASEEALRVFLERPDRRPGAPWVFFYGRGNLRAALDRMNDPAFPPVGHALGSYRLHQVGVNLPPEELKRVLAAGAADTAEGRRPFRSWPRASPFLLVGVYAVDRGDWGEYAAALDREHARARRQLAEGDSIGARSHEGAARAGGVRTLEARPEGGGHSRA